MTGRKDDTMRNADSAIFRIKMVKAMEYIARQVNDEEVFDLWLNDGVADGDIRLYDLAVQTDDPYDLDCYIDDDESFGDLMDTFLILMRRAYKSGGLFCDGVCSKVMSHVNHDAIASFVASMLLDGATEHEYMTTDDAVTSIKAWNKEGIIDLPRGLTPGLLVDEWNRQIDAEKARNK